MREGYANKATTWAHALVRASEDLGTEMPDPRMNFPERPDGPTILRLRQESLTPPWGTRPRGRNAQSTNKLF
jgi:hypothetical protein